MAREETDLYQRGRDAVSLLWSKWRERPKIDDPRDEDFARGALDEIIDRLANSSDIDKEIREFSEAAAEQVTTASRTIYEVLQNADDLGATWLKLGLRRRGGGELLAAHNGKPVEVADIIAMTLAFLSLKRHDTKAKGRFGIGLKTLNQIGSKLSVHCPPYHFAVEKGALSKITPQASVRGLYDPSAVQTLLMVSLDRYYGIEAVEGWSRAIDGPQLLFLDYLHDLSLIDLRTGEIAYSARLVAKVLSGTSLELRPGVSLPATSILFVHANQPARKWTRYSIDYPVPADQKRTHKATGDVTQLSVAISENSESGVLSAGLPLDFAYKLPISLNAQFDPDLSRRGVQAKPWNKWLFERLAELTSAVALNRFQVDAKAGWYAVPLRGENETADDWTNSRLSDLIGSVQNRVLTKVRLRLGDREASLGQLSFVDESAVGLLTEADLQCLAPASTPLKSLACDKRGRWRRVLVELDAGTKLGIQDAISLLQLPNGELGLRGPDWFVRLADSALKNGLGDRLELEKSVLCDDGTLEAPRGDILLVKEQGQESTAARLGFQKRLAPVYFAETTSVAVRSWINDHCADASGGSPTQILSVLARRQDPLSLDESGVLLLRDALQAVDSVRRGPLAAAIGEVIRVKGYEFRKGRKVECDVAPCSAYLPTPIAKDTGGWASAAKSTEGLFWIDPLYGALLRTARGGGLGARRLFVMLGARAGPRIIRQDFRSELSLFGEVPAAQFEALGVLSPRATHIEGDSYSPDLDKVIDDVARQRVDSKRRARSRSLFETLQRDWDEYLSEYADASAMYHHYNWRKSGDIPATWLANLASEPWLSTKTKRKIAPREAAIETTTTRLTRGTKASRFVYEVTETDSSHPLIAALGIKGTPPASELLAELKAIREKHETRASPDDVNPLYAALGALVTADRITHLGDLSVGDLRRQFEARELLFTPLGWKAPSSTFRGRPIFGRLRAFVPESRQLARLWQVLQISLPGVSDCISVLQEIAARGVAPERDVSSIIVDVLRRLAELDTAVSGRRARLLQRVPLWTTCGWETKRPVYAVSDSQLQNSLGKDLPVWVVGCSFQSLGNLPDHLGVELLLDTDFTVSPGPDVEQADEFTVSTFRAAVAHLQSEIAKKSQDLWASINWQALEQLQVFRTSSLSAQTTIAGKPYSVSRRLHVEATTSFYFVDPDEIGGSEVGERILAPFITGPVPAMIDLAWSYAWRRAEEEGPPVDALALATKAEELKDPLDQLGSKGRRAAGKRLFADAGAGSHSGRGKRKLPPPPKPRRLKNFDEATIEDVSIVESDHLSKTIKRPKRRLKTEPWKLKKSQSAAKPVAPVREWSERERELQGFELLAAALKQLDDLQLEDFSALRGIGADSIDNLKRYFELKVFSGDASDEIRFEPSEFERAVQAKGDYFLAVVSGLEEGYNTQIKIFADPVRTLPIRRVPQIRLGGVRTPSSRRLVVTIKTP